MGRKGQKPAVTTGRAVLRRASHLAEDGDDWFLSVARRLSRIGLWARDGADSALGSAAAAISSTVCSTKVFTQRALGMGAGRQNPPPAAGLAPAKARGEPRSQSRPRLYLLSGTSEASPTGAAPAPESVELRTDRLDPTDTGPGVVPLLQAMGRVVADHRITEYATLDDDERLWALIDVLHSLSRPDSAEPTALRATRPATGHQPAESLEPGSGLERRSFHWRSWYAPPDALQLPRVNTASVSGRNRG